MMSAYQNYNRLKPQTRNVRPRNRLRSRVWGFAFVGDADA